jgi:hypothetical protein
MPEETRLIVMFENDNTMRRYTLVETGSKTIQQGLRSLGQSQIETPLLPFGTVIMKSSGSTSVYFIQRPPEKVVIRFVPKSTDKTTTDRKATHYTIAYPWRVFGLLFKGKIVSDYFLRFAKGPIRHMNDELYRPPIPNIDDKGGLCVGYGMVGHTGKESIPEAADKTIDWVDKSNYNNDLPTEVGYIPKEMVPPEGYSASAKMTFEFWQKWTKEAGRKWRDVISLSWHRCETFEEFFGRIN